VNHLALVVEEVHHPEVHRFLEVVVVEVDILLVALVEEVVHHRVAEVEVECHMVVVAEVVQQPDQMLVPLLQQSLYIHL
jgi:hypothetical protein